MNEPTYDEHIMLSKEKRMREVIARYEDNGYGNVVGEIVEDLIRCKDCKFYDDEDLDSVCGRLCVYFAKPNDFCSKAERREL